MNLICKLPLNTMLLLLLAAWQTAAAAADGVLIAAPAGAVPAYLLELPPSVSDILIADAENATMHRFVQSDGKILKKDHRYMSIGLNGAGKQRAWDRKTPLGIYFLTEELDTSRLHDKYGVAAYPLDYPNVWDRQKERTGDGIWLHGVDHKNPERPPLDTDGCLALPNEELLKLADSLEPLVTPVIVARRMAWSSPAEQDELRTEFRLALELWRQSLEDEDLFAYLSLYAEDFRFQDMDRKSWAAYRLGVFAARSLNRVALDDVMLLADPEERDLYLSRFTEILESDAGTVTTTKRLYWRRGQDHRWQIVAEDAG